MNWLQAALRRKDHILGMNRRNLEFVLPRNPRQDFGLAKDKLLAKSFLAEHQIPVAPTITTFSSFPEVQHVGARLADLNDFVLKPARGFGGRGIAVIAGRTSHGYRTAGNRHLSLRGLERHIGDIVFGAYTLDRPDVALVEPRLKPAPFFARLAPDSLSDIRIVLIDERPILAMVRVPTQQSDGRANLHQGALGLGIDIQTGSVRQLWQGRRSIASHPQLEVPVLGVSVPAWSAIVELSKRVAEVAPLKFLGVDIVVDQERGPLVLEFNVRPGLEIQNVNGLGVREAFRRSRR